MANPIVVTIDANGFTPCNPVLYKSNPGASRPNSIQWNNTTSNDISWSMTQASSYLATSAPPNQSNPAPPNNTVPANSTLTLWVKDTANIGNNGVSQTYTLQSGSTTLSCPTQDPPDVTIEP